MFDTIIFRVKRAIILEIIFMQRYSTQIFAAIMTVQQKALNANDEKLLGKWKEKGGTREKGFSKVRAVRLIDRRTPARSQIPKARTFPITVNMQPRHWFNVSDAGAPVPP